MEVAGSAPLVRHACLITAAPTELCGGEATSIYTIRASGTVLFPSSRLPSDTRRTRSTIMSNAGVGALGDGAPAVMGLHQLLLGASDAVFVGGR